MIGPMCTQPSATTARIVYAAFRNIGVGADSDETKLQFVLDAFAAMDPFTNEASWHMCAIVGFEYAI